MEWLLRQSPRQYGVARTRWRLQDVGRALAWLEGASEGGICKVLKRLGFSRKQALAFIHSPDPEFRAKWQTILRAYKLAVEHPDQVILVFEDEFTYYRQPSKVPAYWPQGHRQPLARRQPRANTKTRIAAALNALTGQVLYLQRSCIGKTVLVEFCAQLRAAYPHAEVIYFVLDNWPIHFHAEVLEAMATNGLHPLFLPTYASWLNPIEKLWHWLRAEVLGLHPLANDLGTLRKLTRQFLDQFALPSPSLLAYVGLPV